MIRILNITLSPNERNELSSTELCDNINALKKYLANKYSFNVSEIQNIQIVKESIDARKSIQFIITVDISIKNNVLENQLCKKYREISKVEDLPIKPTLKINAQKEVVIVGFGPAGMFAALECIELGIKPTIIEQGEQIEDRTTSVEEFINSKTLNVHSNIQFGEGGAGTFSDAKLSTGVKNPKIKKILETFIHFGAPESILYKAMPHIGTDIIRTVVVNIRKYLQQSGANIYFNTKLHNIITINGQLREIELLHIDNNTSEILPCKNLLLCIGHSARDTVEMLFDNGVAMEQKPFAIGVRIEHLQTDVNKSRYHQLAQHPALPNAPYNINAKTPDGRGIYSFCMCPGGEVVMASSEKNGIVVNGMSYYARNQVNANAALLVGVRPEDFQSSHPLAGFAFQRQIEQKAFTIAKNYIAPVETVGSILYGMKNKIDKIIPSCKNGFTEVSLQEILPNFIYDNIKYGLPYLANKMACFSDNEAVLSGVETRSSSPVRILRNERCETNIHGIYGCGEGAGYAGGIMSSALDGIRAIYNMFMETIDEKL